MMEERAVNGCSVQALPVIQYARGTTYWPNDRSKLNIDNWTKC